MNSIRKRNYSILIGNAIDHFDTALYGFLAPIFANLYFPNSDPIVSLILTYSVFATTIITRPLGSYIFGMMAVSHGPALSLSYSLIGVAISTIALGLLPTYENIGYLAPALLIFFRTISGIFSAGEITVAKLYILSDNPNKNSYLYQTSTMVGIVIASFFSSIILKDGNENYWRVGFILGGISAFFGYFLRVYKLELPPLKKKKLLELYSLRGIEILFNNKIFLLKIAIVSGFSYMTYSIPFIIINNLAPKFTNVSLEEMMNTNTILLALDTILLPIIGLLITNFTNRNTLLFSSILILVTSPILWYFAENSSFFYLTFIKVWIIIIGIIFSCKVNIWSNELIKTDEKYLITGIGGAIGTSVLGKMAPVIILSLYHYSSSPMVFSWFITIVAIGVIWAIRKK